MTSIQELEENLHKRMNELGVKRMTLEEFNHYNMSRNGFFESTYIFRMWCFDQNPTSFANQVENYICNNDQEKGMIRRVYGVYYDSVEQIESGNFYLALHLQFRK